MMATFTGPLLLKRVGHERGETEDMPDRPLASDGEIPRRTVGSFLPAVRTFHQGHQPKLSGSHGCK